MKRWIVGLSSLFVVIAIASVTLAADPRAIGQTVPPSVQPGRMPPKVIDTKGVTIPKTGTVAITVKYSDTGAPMSGADVWVLTGPSKPGTQATNTQGVATFSNLLNGQYSFGVSKTGYNSNVTTVSANVAGNTTATTLMLSEGVKTESKVKEKKQKGTNPGY